MMRIRAAVIGTGFMGRVHLEACVASNKWMWWK